MQSYPNAKINIGLNIVEKRTDGYHNIETVFYPIKLFDVLDVALSEICDDYSFSQSGIPISGDPENNLVVKAYRLLANDYDLLPVDISLVKQIPFGAGLGGGSSDAAFMLKCLNELFDLKLSADKLADYASRLGADCPFFINNKVVFANGIGNEFVQIDFSLKGYYWLLVKPDIHVSTIEAYSLVKAQKADRSLIEAIKQPIEKWKETIKNDFEPSVFSKYPYIGEIKKSLYQMGALYASMSGSGSSVFGIFDFIPEIEDDFEDCFVACGEFE